MNKHQVIRDIMSNLNDLHVLLDVAKYLTEVDEEAYECLHKAYLNVEYARHHLRNLEKESAAHE